MRNMIAGFVVALVFVVSGVATDTASAQERPVWENGEWTFPDGNAQVPDFNDGSWELPSQETSDELMETFNELAPDGAPVNVSAPAEAPAAPSGGDYASTVSDAAIAHGVSPDYLMGVYGCETGYTYRTDLYGQHGEYGPFQFMESTFYWLAGLMGYEGNWQSAYDQAQVAAWAFANGYASHWVCA